MTDEITAGCIGLIKMAGTDYSNARSLLIVAIIGSKLIAKRLPPIDQRVPLVASLAALVAALLAVAWFTFGEMRKGQFRELGFWLPVLSLYLAYTIALFLLILVLNVIPLLLG